MYNNTVVKVFLKAIFTLYATNLVCMLYKITWFAFPPCPKSGRDLGTCEHPEAVRYVEFTCDPKHSIKLCESCYARRQNPNWTCPKHPNSKRRGRDIPPIKDNTGMDNQPFPALTAYNNPPPSHSSCCCIC